MKASKVWKSFSTKTRSLQFGKKIAGEREMTECYKTMSDLEVVRGGMAVWQLFQEKKNWSSCQLRSREVPNKRKRKQLLIQCNVKLLQEIPCQGVVWILVVYMHSKSNQTFVEEYPSRVIIHKASDICLWKLTNCKMLKDGRIFWECITTWVLCNTFS